MAYAVDQARRNTGYTTCGEEEHELTQGHGLADPLYS